MIEEEYKNYTKISIDKTLHTLVKKICDAKGIKMYHFENQAILNYIKTNYSEYLKEEKI